ncbi:hypothetical protein [Acinetobacter wuhouensis]|uniref:Uncharacterized protein n=1 Tax=Acinetobacter wuhouensis TaxID=1879050 RepID=A0A4Q7AFG2_9GAMM|nr:hypothetical protein [Acinetobacter wuhouensis]RZG45945.1 hypothetical protein EXU28_10680 [Acinetobacter wuhouensis]
MSYADSSIPVALMQLERQTGSSDSSSEDVRIDENQIENQAEDSVENLAQEILEPEPIFQIEPENQNIPEVEDLQTQVFETQEDIQKKIAVEHEQQATDYSILNNNFYQNDRFRIFNYTAYNVEQLKSSLVNPTVAGSGSNEFYISFGYGMEFKINDDSRIGYEYLSSFPYDRGQIIRFFWARRLKY